MTVEEKAKKVDLLWDAYKDCARCPDMCNPVGRDRGTVVLCDGNEDAKLMIIGESPDSRADKEGLPFVGKSGELLDKFLASFNSSREEVFITNIVCCRPTNPDEPAKNRQPTKAEIKNCAERLHGLVELVDPLVILLLGSVPMKTLTGNKKSVSSVARDRSLPVLTATVSGQCLAVRRPALATFHPSYLSMLDNQGYGSDTHLAYNTWEKAFRMMDMYNKLYYGTPLPQRTDND
jgi:uracil-DNA glycosylase